MIRRLFSHAATSVASGAIIVGAFSALSRVIGFLRDRILAGAFGAGDTLDVYYAAFRVPDLLFQLLVVGALSASFIPLFTKHLDKRQDDAWRFTNVVFNALFITFGLISVLAMLGMDFLVPFLVPGFSPEKQLEVVPVARIIFLAQVFFAMSMVYGSVLQGSRRFVISSFAPIVYNVGIMIGALLFAPALGATGLALGTVLGAFAHAIVQFIGVRSLGYRYRLIVDFLDKELWQMVVQMVPRVMGLAVNQLNFLAMTTLASFFAVGSLTMLQFAYNLNYFPIGIVGVSYAIAAFPVFCSAVNKSDMQALRSSLLDSVRQVLFFMVPATVLFLLLRAQIVRLVVGAEAFDWQATIATADTLGFFAVSFVAQALVYLVVRAYFALQDNWTPFIVGLFVMAINISLGLVLGGRFGVSGLALAFSIATCVQLALLWAILRLRLGPLGEGVLVRSTMILSVSGVSAALVTQFFKYEVVRVIPLDTFYAVLLQTLVAGGAGLFIYGAAAFMLGSEEMQVFAASLKRKFLKVQRPAEPVQVDVVQ